MAFTEAVTYPPGGRPITIADLIAGLPAFIEDLTVLRRQDFVPAPHHTDLDFTRGIALVSGQALPTDTIITEEDSLHIPFNHDANQPRPKNAADPSSGS